MPASSLAAVPSHWTTTWCLANLNRECLCRGAVTGTEIRDIGEKLWWPFFYKHYQHLHTDQRKASPSFTGRRSRAKTVIFLWVWGSGPWHSCAQANSTYSLRIAFTLGFLHTQVFQDSSLTCEGGKWWSLGLSRPEHSESPILSTLNNNVSLCMGSSSDKNWQKHKYMDTNL